MRVGMGGGFIRPEIRCCFGRCFDSVLSKIASGPSVVRRRDAVKTARKTAFFSDLTKGVKPVERPNVQPFLEHKASRTQGAVASFAMLCRDRAPRGQGGPMGVPYHTQRIATTHSCARSKLLKGRCICGRQRAATDLRACLLPPRAQGLWLPRRA